MFSGSNLSYLSDLFLDFGVALKLKDNSFSDAKDILDKFADNKNSNKDILKTSDKILLFQIGNLHNLGSSTKITVSKDDLGLGDVDYSNVKAYFFNPANSSFEEQQTTFNAGDNTLTFETDKNGYFAFALKRKIVPPPPPANPNTGDST